MKAKIFALLFTMLLFINGCSDSDQDNNFHNNNSQDNNSQDNNSNGNNNGNGDGNNNGNGDIPAKDPYDCDYDLTKELTYIDVINPNPNGTPVKVKISSHCYGTLIATLDNKLYHQKDDNSTFKDLNFNYPIKDIFSNTANTACYILTEDNKLFSMGKNTYGNLGLGLGTDNTDKTEVLKPTEIKGINGKIRNIYTNFGPHDARNNVYVITEDKDKDRLYGWGGWELGVSGTKDTPTELIINGVNKIYNIYFQNMYLDDSVLSKYIETDKGFYYIANRYSRPTPFEQIKFFRSGNNNAPITINGAAKMYNVDGGLCILSNDNKLYSFYEFGDVVYDEFDLSKIINNKDDIKEIHRIIKPGIYLDHEDTYLLLKTDGTVYSWRIDKHKGKWLATLGYEKLGYSATYDKPCKIKTLSNIKKIHVVSNNSPGTVFALDNDGKVYSWGYDSDLLGDGPYNGQRAIPELVKTIYASSTYNKTTDYKIEDIFGIYNIQRKYPTGHSLNEAIIIAKVKGNNKLFFWGSNTGMYPRILPLGCDVKTIKLSRRSIHDKADYYDDKEREYRIMEILYNTGELRTWSMKNKFRLQHYINIEPQK